MSNFSETVIERQRHLIEALRIDDLNARAALDLAGAQKQITELTAALELTKSSKEDALAAATATIEDLREQLREAVEALARRTP